MAPGARLTLHYGDLTDSTNVLRVIELVREMVEADVRLARRDALMAREGFRAAVARD